MHFLLCSTMLLSHFVIVGLNTCISVVVFSGLSTWVRRMHLLYGVYLNLMHWMYSPWGFAVFGSQSWQLTGLSLMLWVFGKILPSWGRLRLCSYIAIIFRSSLRYSTWELAGNKMIKSLLNPWIYPWTCPVEWDCSLRIYFIWTYCVCDRQQMVPHCI